LTNGSIYERTFDEGVNLVRNHRTIVVMFVDATSLARAGSIVPDIASGGSDLKTAGFGSSKKLVAQLSGATEVFPYGQRARTAGNRNFTPNDTDSHLVAVGVGSDDATCIYSHASADAIVDVPGFYPGDGQPVQVTAADRGLS
jgi:hypothetical protein